MRQITVNLYRFDELSSQAQEKALRELWDINVNYNWWEDTIDNWDAELEKQGFTNPKIYFSGFYSQGDGACFDCDGFDYDAILNSFVSEFDSEDMLALCSDDTAMLKCFRNHRDTFINLLSDSCETLIQANSTRYCHEHTRSLVLYRNFDRNRFKRIHRIVENLTEWLEEKRKELCRKIYRELETEYEYLTSDEAIRETIKANDYEFYEDGKLA